MYKKIFLIGSILFVFPIFCGDCDDAAVLKAEIERLKNAISTTYTSQQFEDLLSSRNQNWYVEKSYKITYVMLYFTGTPKLVNREELENRIHSIDTTQYLGTDGGMITLGSVYILILSHIAWLKES